MANGRMLKKIISTSRKLSGLKTDSARLLYTWLLPHLDIEGRFSAEPDVVKGYIVPRLKTMTPAKITNHLNDLRDNNLIILYKVNGDRYLQATKFKEFQTLRADREAASTIPAPTDSDTTPGVPTDNSGLSEVKLREVKLSEDKIIHREFVRLTPEEFEKLHTKFGKKITDELIRRLDNYIGQIGEVKARSKYKSHYYTILNWARRDGITSPEKKKTSAEKVKELVDAGLLEKE